MSRQTFVEGVARDAQYHTTVIPSYQGNPFIEALPPILGRDEARAAMAYYPEYDERHRLASAIEREEMAGLLKNVRHPVGLHAELYARIARLIRTGYAARNPLRPFYQSHIDQRERSLVVEGPSRVAEISSYALERSVLPTATGMTFLGMSGIGKTVAVQMCLHLFPQLLVHREYCGRPFPQTQIVWLRLDVPPDGSILSLAERFFTAVDHLHEAMGTPTRYRAEYMPSRVTIHRAIPRMGRLASQHALGVLVLDEVQDLSARGSKAMLSFLVQLVNSVGVPVVLIGDLAALPVLRAQFRQARRGASEGDMIVTRAQQGEKWRAFCDVLWRFQYTRERTPMTQAHVDALFKVSAGVTDFTVLAYKLAQQRAIATGIEQVTPATILSIRDGLVHARPVLEALSRDAYLDPEQYPDVVLPPGMRGIPFLSADAPDRSQGKSTMSADQQSVPDLLGVATGKRHGEAMTEVRDHVGAGTPNMDPEGSPRAKSAKAARADVSATAAGASTAGKESARKTARRIHNAAAGDSTARARATVQPVPNELGGLVKESRAAGQAAYNALRDHEVIGDALWARISETGRGSLDDPGRTET